MAKKMGRRARKFAKKNLQSVMKRKRKLNAVFKKKFALRKGNNDSLEESKKLENDLQIPVNPEEEIPDGIASKSFLGDLLIKEDDDFDEDVSDSDGYLSEDPECPYISEDEGESCSEEKCTDVVLLEQNKEINQRLNNQKRKLSKLCDKDSQFSKFLESRRSELLKSRSEAVYSNDEGDTCSIDDEDLIEDEISQVSKVITSSTVDVWCWLQMEQPNSSAVANLLNAFRAACHYGLDTGEVSPVNIADGEVFSKILTFVLSEAEGIFRRLLRFSGSLNKDYILKMTNKPEWKTMRPLIKSFLRSSLFLLNQETDSHILEFVLSQLRSSILLFSAFLSLTKKLIKDELKKIYSWQYLNCVSLWVKFVSCNSKNYDLEQLVFSIIGVIKGITHQFFGPRYLPLRFKCVKMLNQLSSSCGVFIPIESLLFDCLEIRGPNNADGMKRKRVDLALLLKVPKQLLKSQDFHQEIVLSAIKLLAEHLSQWCYHVSFPELATIPLILLKRFHDNTSLESVRRPVKRLIYQVQQNSDFIQRKRDEASFSSKDKESVDNFLLLPVRTLAEIAQRWSHRMVSQTPALPCQATR